MPDKLREKRIILLDNPKKPQTRPVGLELYDWLSQRVQIVAHNLEHPLELAHLPEVDYLVVLGGDGTIMATARDMGTRQIPIIGVNMGKLGFLAEFTVNQFKEHFEEVVTHDALISRRVMLECRIRGPHRTEQITYAVNELAVIAGLPFRMIEVTISIGGEHLAVCAGDGVILATPTGSTAYNLSAGGPILASNLTAAVITPLAAHSLSFRPMVVNLEKSITLRYRPDHQEHTLSANDPVLSGYKAVVVIDGQHADSLTGEDEIVIGRAEPRFQLVLNPRQSQWRVLNTKLNWGARPNYVKQGETDHESA